MSDDLERQREAEREERREEELQKQYREIERSAREEAAKGLLGDDDKRDRRDDADEE